MKRKKENTQELMDNLQFLLSGRLPITQRAKATSTSVARRYLDSQGQLLEVEKVILGTRITDRRVKTLVLMNFFFFKKNQKRKLKCDKYLFDAIFKWIISRCKSLKSIESYLRTFRRWWEKEKFQNLSDLTKFSSKRITDFLFALEADGKSQRYVKHHMDVVRSLFGWLYEGGIIRKSPINRSLPRTFKVDNNFVTKTGGMRQALTLEEAKKVTAWALEVAQPHVGLAVLLQMISGLRSCEVANIENEHIVEREGVFHLTIKGKGGKTRSIKLEDHVVKAINRHQETRKPTRTGRFLLTPMGGGQYDPQTIQRFAKEAAKHIGREKEISSHDLRRTAITLLHENGASIFQLKEFAGHSNPSTTFACYTTRRPEMTATTGI
jgi:integrase